MQLSNDEEKFILKYRELVQLRDEKKRAGFDCRSEVSRWWTMVHADQSKSTVSLRINDI